MNEYNFDESGLNPANKVPPETHTVSQGNGINRFLVFPNYAPFHSNSLVVVHKASGKILHRGDDYELSHYFQIGNNNTAKELHGGFYFLDPNVTVGDYEITYNTLGSDLSNYFAQTLTDGYETLESLERVLWDSLQGVPLVFPVTAHRESVTDIEAVNELIVIGERVGQAIENLHTQINVNDIADLNPKMIEPMMEGLVNIAASIAARPSSDAVAVQYSHTNREDRAIGSLDNGHWVYTGLSLTVPNNGWFIPSWDVEPLERLEQGYFEYRFLANDAVIDTSYYRDVPIVLSEGMRIDLQIRVVGGFLNNATIGSPYKLGTFRLTKAK